MNEEQLQILEILYQEESEWLNSIRDSQEYLDFLQNKNN